MASRKMFAIMARSRTICHLELHMLRHAGTLAMRMNDVANAAAHWRARLL